MTTTSSVQVITPQTLDTMTFPLHARARLIEASAGTGKTFTIAGLYLRLTARHGTAAPQGDLTEATRHHEPLTVDQILVVTFTEAATAELRDRICARTTMHLLRLHVGRTTQWLPSVTSHRWSYWCRETLLNAERQMDEAAVYTIHTCQRMLTQALESGPFW